LRALALHRAALNGREAAVRLLLEKEADVDARDEHGWTVLYWSAWDGHEATVRLLLEKGADIDARDEHGRTALHWANTGTRRYCSCCIPGYGTIYYPSRLFLTPIRWPNETS
jgi:Ankyrin repeats (3 copies)